MTRRVVFPVAAVAQCASLLLFFGCSGNGVEFSGAPLGWGEPVGAEEVRAWSAEGLDTARHWSVAREPSYLMVPDSVEEVMAGHVLKRQRYVYQGVFLPDGRIVLRYSLGPRMGPETLLLHFVDLANGDEVRILAPVGENGESLNWSHFAMLALEQRFVLVGDNLDYGGDTRLKFAMTQSVWYADHQGQFEQPPGMVDMWGDPVGAFPDGSLAMLTEAKSTDSTIVTAMVSVRAREGGSESSDAQSAEVLFTLAAPRDPDRYEMRAPWAGHFGLVTAVAGDMIWVIPTERPELVAVHRSGGIALKVEWEAGDRIVPPGAPDRWAGAVRYPAATKLLIGSDGLLYVQRYTVHDDWGPVRGPEWLVFTQAGELVARLDVPLEWRVLAFDDDSVLAVAADESGRRVVRVHAIERSAR